MNKFKLTLSVMCLFLLGACSDNDDSNGVNNGNPQGRKISVTASVDNLISLTKAGIVEGNTDNESGESFYWNEGDQIRLYFVAENASTIPSVLFKSESINGNTADFIGVIPEGLNGEYTVYASKDLEQIGATAELKGTLPQEQLQKGSSSEGIILPMLSLPVQNIQIVDGVVRDSKSLNFSLKQLNSLLRFTVKNNASQAMTVEQVTVRIEDASGTAVGTFVNEASLTMGLNNEVKWSNINTTLQDHLNLAIEQKDREATIEENGKFDAYISTIPSDGFAVGNNFVVELTLKGEDDKRYFHKKKIEISNSEDFSFLSTGLKAGVHYLFVNELTDASLIKDRNSYTITFEESYYDEFIIHMNYPGKTSTTEWSGWSGNRYPDFIDPVTTLATTLRPAMVGGGSMEGYPWFVSSYNSSSLNTGGIGYYTHDLFVYNKDANDGINTTGGGNNGSDNFIVTYGYKDLGWDYGDGRPILTFADGKARTIKGLYVNSTNYFIAVAMAGNPLSPPLGEGEDVILVATGHDEDGNQISETRMTFATIDGMVDEWTYWDLSSLGDIHTFKINMTGGTDNGYGFSLPAYYAVDDITVEWDK